MRTKTTYRHRGRILLVDDDRGFLVSLQALLEDEGGHEVTCTASADEALAELERGPAYQLVVSDLSMPGKDGIELLASVTRSWPDVIFILMTAHGSIKTAVEAMRLGAFQYLTKPVDPDELLVQAERALEVSATKTRYRQMVERFGDPDAPDELVGSSAGMRELRRTIEGLARVDSTVLIRGETGTGKELVARMIHRQSSRSAAPLSVVNCTAIPRDLLESELFGHEKGAFTGAVFRRSGRVEEADGGTLLLDEIGDMPVDLQPKLLRFLQERTFRRVGGDSERRSDLRVLAATHRDLEDAMQKGDFRPDLYYRLSTIPVHIPPLRERLEDLPELCEHLVAKISLRLGRAPVPVTDQALSALSSLCFPGNVRELENHLERALVLGAATGSIARIEADDVLSSPPRRRAGVVSDLPLEGGFRTLQELHCKAEADLIARALKAWAGVPNREIAERLGTNRRVLELRMKEHGLNKRGTASRQ